MKSILILTIIFISLISCKKEIQPEMSALNENCDCAKEVSAEFEIRELEKLPQFNPIGTDTDTIFMPRNVRFIALEDNADYTWYIGSEIVHTKEVGRYFNSASAGQTITVSLAVRKKANTICLPNDDGYDSITRSFYVQTYHHSEDTVNYVNGKTLMEGTYRMKSNTSVDSFDMIINYIDRPTSLHTEIDIINFDGQGNNLVGQPRSVPSAITYRQIWFDQENILNFNCLSGSFHYRLDNVAEFNFSTCSGPPGNIIHKSHVLLGRKLN